MKISSKGRYALACMVSMACSSQDENITVPELSSRLDISKLYLEQVFSLLRRSGLVLSVKGAQGGYHLARPANEITTYEILAVTEVSLFDEPEETVKDSAPGIEQALRNSLFSPASKALEEIFKRMRLSDLAEEARSYRNQSEYDYII